MFRKNTCLKISAVGLFCCNKFEDTTDMKVSDMPKLRKPYFNKYLQAFHKGSINRNSDEKLVYILIFSVTVFPGGVKFFWVYWWQL